LLPHEAPPERQQAKEPSNPAVQDGLSNRTRAMTLRKILPDGEKIVLLSFSPDILLERGNFRQ
jgi:hypothetical protein